MFNNFLENLLALVLPKDKNVAEIELMTEAELAETIPRNQESVESPYQAVFAYKNMIARKVI